MARRSLAYNGVGAPPAPPEPDHADDAAAAAACWDRAAHRCHVRGGDIRDASLTAGQQYELVTGTPPYFGVQVRGDGAALPAVGSLPACRQSAPARFEFRGGIEAYCEARRLSPLTPYTLGPAVLRPSSLCTRVVWRRAPYRRSRCRPPRQRTQPGGASVRGV